MSSTPPAVHTKPARRDARWLLGIAATAVGPEGLVTAIGIAAVSAVAVARGGPLTFGAGGGAPVVVFGVLSAVTAAAKLAQRGAGRTNMGSALASHFGRATCIWAPFIVLYVFYRGLQPVVEAVVESDLGPLLKAADETLVGVSPAWLMQHIVHPILTEVMAYAYGLMFVFPIALFVLLYARDELAALREVAMAMLTAFYIGLALYLLIPAKSPRLVYNFAVELEGAFGLYELSTQWWDHSTRVVYDAFPSLHTTISSLSLWAAWRWGDVAIPSRPRLLFRLFLPHVVLLWIATLYLRQHYLVDVIAGWALAVVAVWVAGKLRRAFEL